MFSFNTVSSMDCSTSPRRLRAITTPLGFISTLVGIDLIEYSVAAALDQPLRSDT